MGKTELKIDKMGKTELKIDLRNLNKEQKQNLGLNKLIKIENKIIDILKKEKVEYTFIATMGLSTHLETNEYIKLSGLIKPISVCSMKPTMAKKSFEILKDILSREEKTFKSKFPTLYEDDEK